MNVNGGLSWLQWWFITFSKSVIQKYKISIVFGWTDLKGFTVQENRFEWMNVVWLT